VRTQRVPKAALYSASDASTYPKRLVKEVGTELRCPSLRFNVKGQETPCADAHTLVEIMWALPGNAAREFKRTSAQTVCRIKGDLNLVAEIEARHNELQIEEGGKAAQSFLVNNSSSGETCALASASKTSCRWSYRLPVHNRRVLTSTGGCKRSSGCWRSDACLCKSR
jgi:hypothetical protein